MLPTYKTSEKSIERFFCQKMRLLNLPCIKQFNPYEAGWPDRLVLLPGQRVIWVEFKSTGKKPTKIQQQRHDTLHSLDHLVEVISTREQAEALVEEITSIIQIAAAEKTAFSRINL